MTYRFNLIILFLVFACCSAAFSQGSDGSGAAFSGITLAPPQNVFAPPQFSGKVVVFCYALQRVQNSSFQPYILTQVGSFPSNPEVPCAAIDEGHPLVSGDKLVVAISDMDSLWGGSAESIELVNLNVTPQQASPLNPAPVRGTVTPPSTYQAKLVQPPKKILFIVWPQRLKGDTTNEVTIKALYKATPSTKELALTLFDLTYPQVHSLSHYNVALGVVGSTVENPSFVRVQTSAASGTPGTAGFVPAQFKTVENGGDPEVAPILMFTIYVPPFDAERSWRSRDLIPQPGVGFSLSSPSADFFFGASSEIRRNIQLVGGLHVGKMTTLVKPPFDDPTSSAAPQTQQSFAKGGFVGLTFNIDFIKGLFGK